jgi:hypothetical protein
LLSLYILLRNMVGLSISPWVGRYGVLKRIVTLVAVAVMTAVMLLVMAASAFANCGNEDCSVGASGDKASDNAQGFRFEGPGHNPDTTVTNTGNSKAGRLNVDRLGNDDDTISGTFNFRDGTFIGHATGTGETAEFGNWSGQCAEADFPC